MRARSKLRVLVAVVVILILIRASAPAAIEYYLNEQVLLDLGDYSGHVENVDLALWRGAVRVDHLRVEKVTGTEWVRFLTVPGLEVSINPLGLFRGVVQTEIIIDQPDLNIVDGADEADKQTGAGLKLPDDSDDSDEQDKDDSDDEPLFPMELAKLEIRQGRVAFRNFTSEPPVNLPVQNIDLVATYLTVDFADKNPPQGSLKVSADLLGGSPFSAEAEYQAEDFRNFMFAIDMTLRDLTQLNSFARVYGNLDFNSGHGTLVMEVDAENGKLTGYAKPAFEDVGIFDWKAEMEQEDTNPLQLMWEGVAGAVTQIFSNRETDTLATRIDIEGEIPESPEVSAWNAAFGIVSNAFVEAINTNFEHITPLETTGAQEEGSAENEGGARDENQEGNGDQERSDDQDKNNDQESN